MSEDSTLAAIEALYRSRYGEFERVASAITGSRESGRDAVHDAFVSAVRAWGSYRGEGTVEAWLWPIVINTARKRCRDPRERLSEDEPPETPVWSSEAEPHPEIRAEVAALPERQRLMIFLRYYADLDYQTIARITGVRVGTVGAELHAAHRSLRRHLEEVPLND